ncbi:MAG: FtsQ-type POTRA domain-containing protein [Candidatus Obscuribacterales bacterium]|nr:FtsQ-type POTRA domain-containing protein [Steroidobacteraceae bacterium]
MWFGKQQRQATETWRSAEQQPAPTSLLPRRRVLVVIACVLSAVALSWVIITLLDRPVRRIEVAGQFHRVSPLQIERAVLPFKKRGFVSLPLVEVKQAIEAIAWVDHARVERSWPSGVTVFITEQIPGARWGERGLLNSRGELFVKEARFIPNELPQLEGPEGTEAQVARLYLDTYPRLAGVGLRLARVTLDARGAWQLTVTSAQNTNGNNSGVDVRLGRLEVQQRLERFIRAASPVVAARAADVAYVDMRYSNGFAVGWLTAAHSGIQSGAIAKIKKEMVPDA